MTDWASKYNSGGSGSGGGSSWASKYNSGSSSGSKSSGGGGWLDSVTGDVGGFLGHHFGGVGEVASSAYHQGGDLIHGVFHAIPSIPGDIIHTFGPHGVTANLGTPWDKYLPGYHPNQKLDPHNLVQAQTHAISQDIVHLNNPHYIATHPLNYALDIAALGSLGGGAALGAARAGRLGESAANVARAERVLSHTNETGTFNVSLREARTLQGRIRQQAFDRWSAANPDARIFGLHARTSRILNTRLGVSMLRARVPFRQFQQITQQLTPAEKFAFHVGAEGVPLGERIAFYKAQQAIKPTRTLNHYLDQLTSSDVRDALTNPRPEFVQALHAGRDLEAQAGQRLTEAGIVSPESRTGRAAMPQELMQGTATPGVNAVHPDFPAPFRFWHTTGSGKSLEGNLMNPDVSQLHGKVKDLSQAKHSAGYLLERGTFLTDPERVLGTDYLSTMRHELFLATQKGALDQIAQALAPSLAGFKGENEWYYRPSYNRKTTAPVDRATQAEQRLAHDRAPLDVALQQKNLRRSRDNVVAENYHDLLSPQEAASLPESDAARLERLNQLGVKRLPAAYGKDFRREFAGTPAAVRYFVDRPLDVWRAITLNFRPAWAVNNFVGNTVMGLAAHPESAAYYLRFLRTQRGEKPLRLLWKWTDKRPLLRRKYRDIFQEIAPELHSAGLFGTQTRVTAGGIHEGAFRAHPAVRALGFAPKQLGRGIMKVGAGITKVETTFAEDIGREAMFVSAAGGDLAKIRATAKAMGEGNISLEQALRRMDQASIEKAVNAVNDALGNFNDLGYVERSIIRRLVPFYSWYKVITKVAAKYAARYPARLLLMKNIAAAKKKAGEPALPSWLEGSFAVGGGRPGYQRLISTQGINPYETIPQTLQGGPVGLLNPAVGAFVVGASGRNATFGNLQDYYGPGATSRGGWPGFLERTAGAGFGSLAPVRLGLGLTTPYQGKLYDPKTYRRNLLLQYLGIPVRDVNKAEAKRERGL